MPDLFYYTSPANIYQNLPSRANNPFKFQHYLPKNGYLPLLKNNSKMEQFITIKYIAITESDDLKPFELNLLTIRLIHTSMLYLNGEFVD